MATHPNRTPIYTQNSRRRDATGGYDISIRADGTIRIEHWSIWQGSRSGDVYIAQASPEMMATARGEVTDDEAPEMPVLIHEYLSSDWMQSARRIRLGYVIR